MATLSLPLTKTRALITIYEESKKLWDLEEDRENRNPVIESSEFAYKATNLVQINDDGVKLAAKHIRHKLLKESYTPRTWRTHPLHICPSDTYDLSDPMNKSVLDWVFLISSLNFSFWSEKEGRPDRYGVEWRAAWDSDEMKVWTGYWSLVASLNRALEEEIPITDPRFYSSETLCPDSLIEYIFRGTKQSNEPMPLLQERIAIMREVGYILCNRYGGSFKGFIDEFQRQHYDQGTSLDLVKMVTQNFPSFQDEVYYENTKGTGNQGQVFSKRVILHDHSFPPVCLWKRAQILVAEIWAAFYPASEDTPHPLFQGTRGPEISSLTMFADYRIPQILHHLCILKYPSSLLRKLNSLTPLLPGCREEVSLRSASIIAVERVREEILRLIKQEGGDDDAASKNGSVSSVLIDFYLWDLAKKIERGDEKIEGIKTAETVPTHRTRSIWY